MGGVIAELSRSKPSSRVSPTTQWLQRRQYGLLIPIEGLSLDQSRSRLASKMA
jgi:hypothetical protein